MEKKPSKQKAAPIIYKVGDYLLIQEPVAGEAEEEQEASIFILLVTKNYLKRPLAKKPINGGEEEKKGEDFVEGTKYVNSGPDVPKSRTSIFNKEEVNFRLNPLHVVGTLPAPNSIGKKG